MPEAAGDLHRQAVSQLAGEHHNLAPVMTFVGNEITKHVTNIQREIAPHVSRRSGNRAPLITAELEQAQDARAAALQCWNEVLRFHLVTIDAPRYGEAVFLAERLDPHTARIVNVAGNHPNGATRCSRYFGIPEFGRQMLNQKNRDAIVSFPGAKDCISKVGLRSDTGTSGTIQLTSNDRLAGPAIISKIDTQLCFRQCRRTSYQYPRKTER